jgi:endoglucanase
VNQSGTEYACVQGWGIFDGRHDPGAVAAIASFGVNAVRLPLNEDCWLGINGVAPEYSGSAYRSAIVAYVGLLHRYGLYAILDLHWSAPGGRVADDQRSMPDADHAPSFWYSVASTFKDDPDVLFDLFNEPHDVSWDCWRDGCLVADGQAPFRSVGMAGLVNAVRRAGAHNPVLLGGLDWANDLDGWLSHRPDDPDHALVASWHVYDETHAPRRLVGRPTCCRSRRACRWSLARSG